MKVLVDPETDQLLGASILGISGGEIASMIQIAMMGDLRYQELREGIFSHPTLAESLNNLFSSLD
jgi:pyruvate/2-oxoglutarate dehydrogenase complex dihydrolipoamide dehydrogenase (E3) component